LSAGPEIRSFAKKRAYLPQINRLGKFFWLTIAFEKATITNTQTGERIPVMFNPEEYSLDLANTFAEIGIPGLSAPPIQYVRGNLRHLKR